MRERLGHEGGDEPALLCHRLNHVAKEDGSIAKRERIAEAEVLFELAVGVFVVGGIVIPAQRVDVARHVGDKVEAAGERSHVVTGLSERVLLIRDLDRAVRKLPHEEILKLDADLELEASRSCAVELTAQDCPWAVQPRLAVDVEITGETCHVRSPRQTGVTRRIRDGDQIRGHAAAGRRHRQRTRRTRPRP